MRGAEGQNCECNRHADEGPEQAPQERPEEDRKQHDDRRDRQHRAGHPRLDIAADHELNDVQADEEAKDRRPAIELRHRQQGGKQRGDEGTDKRDIVEHESNHAPLEGEWQTGNPAKTPTKRPVTALIFVRTSRYFRNFAEVAALPSSSTRAACGYPAAQSFA